MGIFDDAVSAAEDVVETAEEEFDKLTGGKKKQQEESEQKDDGGGPEPVEQTVESVTRPMEKDFPDTTGDGGGGGSGGSGGSGGGGGPSPPPQRQPDVPEDARPGDVIITGGGAEARQRERVVTEGGGLRKPTEKEQEQIEASFERQAEQAEEQREAFQDISRLQSARIEDGRVREMTGEEEEILEARRARFSQAEELTESRRAESRLEAARGDVSRSLERTRTAEAGTRFFFSPDAVSGTEFEDQPTRTVEGEEVVVLDPEEAETFLSRRRRDIETALEGQEEFQRQAGTEVRRLEAVEKGIARGDISEFVTGEEAEEREQFRQSVQDIVGDDAFVTGPVSLEEQRETTDAEEVIAQLGPVERTAAIGQASFTNLIPAAVSAIPGGRSPRDIIIPEAAQAVTGEEDVLEAVGESLTQTPTGIVGTTGVGFGALGAAGRTAGVALQGTRASALASPTVARGLLGAGAVGATALGSREVGRRVFDEPVTRELPDVEDIERGGTVAAEFGFGAGGATKGLRAGSRAAGRFFAPRVQQVRAARPAQLEQFEVPGGRTGRGRAVFEIASRQRDLRFGRVRRGRSPLVDEQVTEFGILDIGAARTTSLPAGGAATRGTGTFRRFGRIREGEEGVSILEGESPVRFEFTTRTGERLPTQRVAEAVGRTEAFGIKGARPEIPVLGARQTRTRVDVEGAEGVEEFRGLQFTQDRLQVAEGPVSEVFRGGTVGETGGTPTGTPFIGRVVSPERFPSFRFTQTFENFRGFDASVTRDIDTPVGSLSRTLRAESQAVPEFGSLARNLAEVTAQPPAAQGGAGLVPATFTEVDTQTTTDEAEAGEMTTAETRTETGLTRPADSQTGVTVETAQTRFTAPAPTRRTGVGTGTDVDVGTGVDVGAGADVDVGLEVGPGTGPAAEAGVDFDVGVETGVGQVPGTVTGQTGLLDLRQFQFQTQRQAQIQRLGLSAPTAPAVTGRPAPPVAAAPGFLFDGGRFDFGVSGGRGREVSADAGRPLDIDIISANLAEFETGTATLPGEEAQRQFRRRRSAAGPLTRLRAQEVVSGEAVRPETFDSKKLDELV